MWGIPTSSNTRQKLLLKERRRPKKERRDLFTSRAQGEKKESFARIKGRKEAVLSPFEFSRDEMNVDPGSAKILFRKENESF